MCKVTLNAYGLVLSKIVDVVTLWLDYPKILYAKSRQLQQLSILNVLIFATVNITCDN